LSKKVAHVVLLILVRLDVCCRHGIAKWFGVAEKDMATVLPNMAKFKGDGDLFSQDDMFSTA